MNRLAALASEGLLNPVQRQEAEFYDQIGIALGIMQSKARMSLTKTAKR